MEFTLVNNCTFPITLPSKAPFTIRMPLGPQGNVRLANPLNLCTAQDCPNPLHGYDWGIVYQPDISGDAPILAPGQSMSWSWNGMANHIFAGIGTYDLPKGTTAVQNPPVSLMGQRLPQTQFPLDETGNDSATVPFFAVAYDPSLLPYITPDPYASITSGGDPDGPYSTVSSQPCFGPTPAGDDSPPFGDYKTQDYLWPQDPNYKEDGNPERTDTNIHAYTLDPHLLFCFFTNPNPFANKVPVANLNDSTASLSLSNGIIVNQPLANGPVHFGSEANALTLSSISLKNNSTSNESGLYDVSIQFGGQPGDEQEVRVEQYNLNLSPGAVFNLPDIPFNAWTDSADEFSMISDAIQMAADEKSNALNLSVVVRPDKSTDRTAQSESRIGFADFPTVAPTNVVSPETTVYNYSAEGNGGSNGVATVVRFSATSSDPVIPQSTNLGHYDTSNLSTLYVTAGAGDKPDMLAQQVAVPIKANGPYNIALKKPNAFILPVNVTLNESSAYANQSKYYPASKGSVTITLPNTSKTATATVANGVAVFPNVSDGQVRLNTVAVPYTVLDSEYRVLTQTSPPIPQTVQFDNPASTREGVVTNPTDTTFIYTSGLVSSSLTLGMQEFCATQDYTLDSQTKKIDICLEDDGENGLAYGDSSYDFRKSKVYLDAVPRILNVVNKLAAMPPNVRPPFIDCAPEVESSTGCLVIRLTFNHPDDLLASYDTYGKNYISYLSLGSRVVEDYVNTQHDTALSNVIVHEFMHSVDAKIATTNAKSLWETDVLPAYNQAMLAQFPMPKYVKNPENIQAQDYENSTILYNTYKQSTGVKLWDLVSYNGNYKKIFDGGYNASALMLKEKFAFFFPAVPPRTLSSGMSSLNAESFAEEASTSCTYSNPKNVETGTPPFPVNVDAATGKLSLKLDVVSALYKQKYGNLPSDFADGVAAVEARLNLEPLNQVYTYCIMTYPNL